jgi:histidinol-phosphate aminotransferase
MKIRQSVLNNNSYTPGEQPQLANCIKLNTNESPFPPTPKIKDFLVSSAENPEPTSRLLRESIACNLKLQPEQVLIGNGSDEVLSLLIKTIVEPNEQIGFLDVTYSLYKVMAELHGAKVTVLPTQQGTFLPPKLDDQIKLILSQVKLFFIASPNPPVGYLVDREWLAEVCECLGGYLVVDEAYIDFASTECLELLNRYPNIIFTRTFSKGYALAGLRVGYSISSVELAQELHKVRDSYNCDLFAQKLALIAYNDNSYYEGIWQQVLDNRKLLKEKLEQLNFEVLHSEANFLLVKPLNVNAKKLYQTLKERNIFIRYFDTELLQDFLRITVGSKEEILKLVEEIEAFEVA